VATVSMETLACAYMERIQMCVVRNDYPSNLGSMKITLKLRRHFTKEATMEAMEVMQIIADHRIFLCHQWLGSNCSL
jgi:hypothetical protein